jgi:protein involved in polysaccharide export with SLBB domain
MMTMRRTLLLLASLWMVAVSGVEAQTPRGWDPAGLQLSRAELEELLARYEETANSSAYSSSLRSHARAEAQLLRQRLEDGDLRVGDRVVLVVERHLDLTDTFNVVAGRKLVLPVLGEVGLEGVLRSELQPHMEAFVARFINSPIVHARSLVRLEVRGAVVRPGFYTVPSDMLISDVMMMAGGPTGNAQLDKTRIERGRAVIWSGDRLRDAIIEGRTLDQISIRAGDNILVPDRTRARFSFENVMYLAGALSTLLLLTNRAGVF